MSYPVPDRLHGVRHEDHRHGEVTTNCGRVFSMGRAEVDLSGKRVMVHLRAIRPGDPVPHICHTCERVSPLFGSSE